MVRRMGVHETIVSRKVPKPVGNYAQAVLVRQPGEMLFVAGQIPLEPPQGTVFTGAIARQAELVFTHIKNLLAEARFSSADVVRCTIYLTDLGNYTAVDAVYARLLGGLAPPARVVVEVAGLPKGVGIEAEVLAIKPAAAPAAAAEPPEMEYG